MLSKTLAGALGAGILALGAAGSAHAATFTVNSTANSGGGTLRSAINAANNTKAADTIEFAFGGTAVRTLTPASALPAITQPVTIDGYTQRGAAPATPTSPAVLKIVLDASNSSRGLVIDSDGAEVRGLDVQGADDVGIEVAGRDNVIAGNHIGTDVTATATVPNGQFGVTLNGPDNVVGGPGPEDRNIISGNLTGEVDVQEGTGNLIQGNRLGTDATGTSSLGFGSGVIVTDGGTEIRDNLISGETSGLDIYSDDNVVQGNQVGTDDAGTAAVPNFVGINVLGGAGNQIGGTGDGEENLISGNDASGLQLIADGDGNPSQDNTVQGNLIGVDVTGTAELPNGGFAGLAGVTVSDSSDNTLGGTADNAGNVIAGNAGAGVQLLNADDNVLRGNWIGTDATGALNLGNGGAGVEIDGRFNSVGDTGARAGNTIAHNGEDGVTVDAGAGNAVLRNSIHDNHGLAIDLGADGATANDDAQHDADEGANGLQNSPVIGTTATATDIPWTLESELRTDYRLEFYANDDCSAKKVTEAQTFLASVDVSTDSNGHADGSQPITLPAGAGKNISMTATKLDDPRLPTSEVSPCRTVS